MTTTEEEDTEINILLHVTTIGIKMISVMIRVTTMRILQLILVIIITLGILGNTMTKVLAK